MGRGKFEQDLKPGNPLFGGALSSQPVLSRRQPPAS